MLQELYTVLKNNNLYSKTFDEFVAQYQNDDYKKQVYSEVKKRGLYSRDYMSFALKFNTRNTPTRQKFRMSMPDIEIKETQEKNTALEDTFGKNLATDFVSDIWRAGKQGWNQSAAVNETFELFNKGGKSSDRDIDDFIKMYNQSTQQGVSDEMRDFQRIYEAEGKDTFAWFKGVSNNLSVLPQLFISSMAAMARSLESEEVWGAAATAGGVGAAAGSVIPIIGTIAGGIGGIMGGVGGAMETSLTFAELLKAKLGDKAFTRENVRALLNDPEAYQDIKEKAVMRGVAIGAIETLTGGLAGKAVTQVAKVAGRMAQIGAGVGIEAAGGSLGEVAGRLAADQEMDTAEILFEGFAGMSTAPVTVGSALLRTPEYTLNGEKLSGAKFRKETSLLSDAAIAKADIQIKNDNALAKTLYDRQNDAIIRSQLDARITGETDRNNLFDKEKELKSLENKNTESAKQRISEIKEEIKLIRNKYAFKTKDVKLEAAKQGVQKALRTNLVRKSAKFAQSQGKLIGLKTKSYKTKKEFNEAAQKLLKKHNDKKFGTDVSNMDGVIIGDEIIINEERAAEIGAVNVGSHELLHGILTNALKNDILKGEVITDFIDTLKAKDRKVLDARLQATDKKGNKIYTDTYLQDNPDEYLTILSDAMNSGQIKLDAPQLSFLGEIITNLLRKFGFKQIEFKTTDDVRNFMVEYHKSVQKGELSAGILGVAGTVKDVDLKLSASESTKVQQIYDEKGKDGIAEITNAYKPMAKNIANKYRDVPGFTTYKEDFISELLYGERGVMGLIEKYKPGEVPLAAYINKYLRSRSIEVANKIFKKEFEIDVQEAVRVAADDITVELDPVKKETSRLRKKLDISEKVVDKVRESVRKTFGTKLPNVTSKKFKASITKSYRTELKPTIANMMGTRAKYRSFLEDNFETLLEALPISTLNKRFKQFSEAVTDDKGKPIREKTAQGNTIFRKKKLSKNEFVNYFLGDDVGASTKGTRKDALAEELGVELGFDATMETLQEPEILGKFKDVREITGLEELSNLAEITAKQIDRQVDVKFSVHGWTDLNNAQKDLTPNQLDNWVSDVVKLGDKLYGSRVQWNKLEKEKAYDYIDKQKGFSKYVKSYVKHLINADIYEAQTQPFQPKSILKSDIPIASKKELLSEKLNTKPAKTFHLTTIQKKKLFKNLEKIILKYPKEVLDVMFPFMPRSKRRDFSVIMQQERSLGEFTDWSKSLWVKLEKKIDKIEPSTKEQLAIHTAKYGDPSHIRIMNKGLSEWRGNIFTSIIKELKENGKISDKLKLEIQNANVANINTASLIVESIADSNMSVHQIYNYFQSQSDIVMGIRGLTRLTLFDNDLSKVSKDIKAYGEHIYPNASTMFDLMVAVLKKKHDPKFDLKSEIKTILSKHNQLLTVATKSSKMDKMMHFTEYGHPRGNTNNVSNYERIVSLLDKKESETFQDLDGNKGSTIAFEMSAKESEIKLREDLIKKGEKKAAKSNMRPSLTVDDQMKLYKNFDKALAVARDMNAPRKGISIIDFDDTLATTTSKITYTIPRRLPDGRFNWGVVGFGAISDTGKLTPAEFAQQHETLSSYGAIFDYSEFNEVKGGKKGPYFNKAKSLKDKFGNNDIFILSARPQNAAVAIHAFLKGVGLNIKEENIIGLEDGTPIAKADFIVSRVAEGYNDFLFADDQIKNVKAVSEVLDVLDVKGKVHQAQAKFSVTINDTFNEMLEANKGIHKKAKFSPAAAKTRGARSDKFWARLFVPPGADDFRGLLDYFVGKGKKGDQQRAWFKKVLHDPFARAYRDLNAGTELLRNEYVTLKKQFPGVRKLFRKDTGYSNFTYEDAIRVYLWDKFGMDIPGISKRDLQALKKVVNGDPDMIAFADQLSKITKMDEGYVPAGSFWTAESIQTDINNVHAKHKRKILLKEWVDNKNIIFSSDNMNKIEAAYGENFREALDDMLFRMEKGTNRKFGKNKLVNEFSEWVNNSVGAIMFFKTKSAVLQLISFVNYINWGDNNPIKVAASIVNFPQFAQDFAMIFNSSMLKQRRKGLKTDVNASEIAKKAAGASNKISAMIAYMLKKGFLPTQMADSFAISLGGASLYRNRLNTYLKQGMTEVKAKKQAWLDFQEITEEGQQSARPDLISAQQASPLGRLILAFQNTPMQYTRMMKKAMLNLANGRGDMKTNISKIVYYGAVQNFIFSALQNALFNLAFEDEEEEKKQKKYNRIANNMVDTIMRGSGVYGAIGATVKNVILKFIEENKKDWNADNGKVLVEALNLSPPIGSKARKIYNAFQTYKFNKKVIKGDPFNIDNPSYEAVGSIVSGTTNIPLDRVYDKVQSLREVMDGRNEAWQRIAMFLGWKTWEVGAENEELEALKKRHKKNTQKKKKQKIYFH